jgi:hypothetical protein
MARAVRHSSGTLADRTDGANFAGGSTSTLLEYPHEKSFGGNVCWSETRRGLVVTAVVGMTEESMHGKVHGGGGILKIFSGQIVSEGMQRSSDRIWLSASDKTNARSIQW